MIELVGELERKGVALRSLQEAIDTTFPGGKLIFHVFGALAEFERNLIRERTQAGLAAARARGRKGGWPKSLDSEKRNMAVKLYREGNHTVQEICRLVGVSKPLCPTERMSRGFRVSETARAKYVMWLGQGLHP